MIQAEDLAEKRRAKKMAFNTEYDEGGRGGRGWGTEAGSEVGV